MAKRTREERKADNIAAETQRRINQGDRSSYVQGQIRDNPGQFQNKERVTESVNWDTSQNNTYNRDNFAQATPAMTTGYGSWFGANSGSTGSSALVQQTIQNSIDKALQNKEIGQSKGDVINQVMNNLYPSLPQMSKEEFLTVGGVDINNPNEMNSNLANQLLLDYDISSMYTGFEGGTGNLMGIPPGRMGIDQLNMMDRGSYYGGGGGGGGGFWGSGGGGGGGGYGGGGGGYGPPEKPQFPGQPGERWGAQMPLQQAMINIHGGQGFQQGFARGGIVSLVE